MAKKHYIECPFCSGLIEPKQNRRILCPECRAALVYDAERRLFFVDTNDLRLPIQGTVCTRCGLLQSEFSRHCLHCDARLVGTQQ